MASRATDAVPDPRLPVDRVLALLAAAPPRIVAVTADVARAALQATQEPLPPGRARGAAVTGAGKPPRRGEAGYAAWMAIDERPHVARTGRVVVAPGA